MRIDEDTEILMHLKSLNHAIEELGQMRLVTEGMEQGLDRMKLGLEDFEHCWAHDRELRGNA